MLTKPQKIANREQPITNANASSWSIRPKAATTCSGGELGLGSGAIGSVVLASPVSFEPGEVGSVTGVSADGSVVFDEELIFNIF